MTNERDRTLDALREFEAACATARRVLRHDQTTAARVRSQLERDEPLTTVVARNRVASARANLTNTVAELERARSQMRMACFRLGLEEGATVGELGRLWGFSRQLASRIAHEALNIRPKARPSRRVTNTQHST